jgi:hypothetical protein
VFDGAENQLYLYFNYMLISYIIILYFTIVLNIYFYVSPSNKFSDIVF